MRLLTCFLGLFLLGACSGEDRATRLYGPQAYATHGDTLPWANERFESKVAWEHQMNKRARLLNEYARIQ